MQVRIIVCLLLLEIMDGISSTTMKANELIENICDNLEKGDSFQLDEDQQWRIICQEFFLSKDDDQFARKRRDTDDKDVLPNPTLQKAVRGGRGVRIGGGVRTGGGIRTGSGVRTTSGSRYRNSITGLSIPRPNGYLWSRSRLIFLPIATRYFHRSRSASNRYTTPSGNTVSYYYCTSDTNTSAEIQCSSTDGDDQCCEDEQSREPFCCGDGIPDYITQDMNRATQAMARLFYTLAALALCMHLFMRRFRR